MSLLSTWAQTGMSDGDKVCGLQRKESTPQFNFYLTGSFSSQYLCCEPVSLYWQRECVGTTELLLPPFSASCSLQKLGNF